MDVFSPDGSRIVYNRIAREDRTWKRYYGGMAQDLWLYEFATATDRRLTDYRGTDRLPMWIGDDIYFASDREDEIFDIYRLDLDTRDLSRLTHVSGSALNPVPGKSIEGERIGFQAFHRGKWDLFVADADQGENVGTSEPVADEVVLAPFVPAVSITIDPEHDGPPELREYLDCLLRLRHHRAVDDAQDCRCPFS